MPLFKLHGAALGFKNPGELAKAIVSHMPDHPMIAETSVTPQGFVNVTCSQSWLQSQIQEVLVSGVNVTADVKKTIAIDFSSPNIAKEMHVGHLRSTIIGESLSRIFEFVGHNVLRINHIGDWGTQFGMLIEYMRETYPEFETNCPNVSDLQEFYKASKKRFDEDADFKKRAQEVVVRLQSGDEACLRAWHLLCDVSRKEFQKVYSRLNISLEECGESFYNGMLPGIVSQLKDKGLVVESDGAQCIFTSVKSDPTPLMVVKGDGGFGYDSTDMAAINYRLNDLKASWLIYITDIGQQTHFHKIFDAARMAGWHNPPESRCDHLGLGLVCGSDGKKFKTRSGDVVKLVDLLDEARDRALIELRKRAEELGESYDEEDLLIKAEKMGISAIKYFDMKRDVTTNYIFSFDTMLDPRGNSAVFLMYAYARVTQLLEKCSKGSENIPAINIAECKPSDLEISHAAERAIVLHLCRFPEVLNTIMSDLSVNRMCEYLYELCDKLTTFYTQCKVMGAPDQKSKMVLVKATQDVMSISFRLIGMDTLDKL